MEVMVTIGAIRRAKLQTYCHQQINTQLFTGWMLPVTQPTVSQHWRKVQVWYWYVHLVMQETVFVWFYSIVDSCW